VSDTIEAPSNQFTGAVSAARCGTNIVVGFGDAESSSPDSFAGFAVSRNDGATFGDGGVLPVSADSSGGFGPDILGADNGFGGSFNNEYPAAKTPSVSCSTSSLFFYASVYLSRSNADFATTGCSAGPICSAISLSISKNGGVSWGLPSPVAVRSGDSHDLAFPAMAVDPSNPQRLYVAYINNNNFGPAEADEACLPLYQLRLASSADSGSSWTDKLVDYACTDGNQPTESDGELMAPAIAVGPDGNVYLAYEFVPQGSAGMAKEIRFSRSVDHGLTFTAPLHVSTLLGNNAPKLAVDRTHSKFAGAVYLTWSGAPAGTYTSVLQADSLNSGASFSFPRPINGTPATGTGRFQANPVIAVDNDGQVQICYYNTPTNTPTSTSLYSYNCATSFNHAATWQLQRVANSAPAGYDAVTSDFLTHHDGFFNAFELQSSSGRSVFGQFSDIN
jgi:hypothetical protein